MKQHRNPTTVHPPPAAYSHQIEVSGDERLLVLSGQMGMHVDGTVPDDPLEQLDVALTNVELNLEAAGMDLGDLVKLTFYLVGEMDLDRRRELLAARLGRHRPCMTLLFVSALATPSLKVEVDAWAAKRQLQPEGRPPYPPAVLPL
jgi:2-iminobutanoate/2-iminopropanoate deaminase